MAAEPTLERDSDVDHNAELRLREPVSPLVWLVNGALTATTAMMHMDRA